MLIMTNPTMRKYLLTIVFVLLMGFSVKSQDTVRIVHTNYTSVFSISKHYPVLVEWWVTKAKATCPKQLPRKDQFQEDPKLSKETNLEEDYLNSGYDRGHMCAAIYNECQGDQVLTECFYFSNIVPQFHALNAGDFKSVETLTKDLSLVNDSVHVWAGSVGEAKKIGKKILISVPTQYWKVIYIVKLKQYQAYVFNNTNNKQLGIKAHLVNLNVVQSLTGFKFNH